MTAQLLHCVTDPSPEFHALLSRLTDRGQSDLGRVEPEVREIIAEVTARGDAALSEYVRRFEGRAPAPLFTRDYGGLQALRSLDPEVRAALEFAAARIRRYHERQREHLGGFEERHDEILLGSRVSPLDRVAVYAPGGKARYPSSVLMSAIPAAVAGVRDILVATPDAAPEVRAACHLAGVHGLLDAGGAQAIAALAHGTESVPRCDKIVGPGNLYVTAAKRLVFGRVSIDGLAGPSEILVIADDSASPRVVAADLLSQAEHDEAAYPLLLSTSAALVSAIDAELVQQLGSLPRREVAAAALRVNGHALVVSELERLVQVANQLAVEHVALHTRHARQLCDRIVRAGAVFIGHATPEAAGDYVAGPSHVLPTGGAARFGAPLGVYDFVSRSSLIEYSADALRAHGEHIRALARSEGLEAHARAVEVRTHGTPKG